MSLRYFYSGAAALACTLAAACAGGLRLSLNPYEGVDWDNTTQHKANLHTHTVSSGGMLFLNQVLSAYAKRGYTILAVTEHDRPTHWEKSGTDPMAEFGILPVPGQEYSKGHHVNGFFLDDEIALSDTSLLAHAISRQGGVAVLNHPGRYWKPDEDGKVPKETRDEYVKLLDESPLVLGIEVFNRNEKRLNDKALWDAVLSVSMPARPVWGFANDDMHEAKQLGYNWNVFLPDELTESSLRHAMVKGHFYFSVRKHNSGDASDPPVIQRIVHDPAAQTLTVSAAADGAVLDAGHYRWIADGNPVQEEGAVLHYNRVRGILRYVRVELEGKGGTTYTNPFGFSPAEGVSDAARPK